MKKLWILSLAALLLASTASATFVVVLKDGTRYKAKEKWSESNGQAIVQLESGGAIQFDAGLIDVAETERVNELGLGDARLLTIETAPAQQTRPRLSPLGSLTNIRSQSRANPQTTRPGEPTDATIPEADGPPRIGMDVVRKFSAAFENVGLYDAKVERRPGYALRVQLTANDEDDVMKAISATSYVMANLPNSRIDLIELFMATLNGGSAGRFQMTPDHAKALASKELDWRTYFVKRVIF